MPNSKIDSYKILNTLMLNWIVTNLAPTLIILLGLWVPHVWLPFLTLIFVPLLIMYGNYMSHDNKAGCTLIRRYTEYALMVSAVIMMVINLADTQVGHRLLKLEPHRGVVPYVPAVIIYPILTIFKAIQYVRIGKTGYCRACSSQSGSSADSTLLVGIFDTQTRFLNVLTVTILGLESAVMLVYYFTSYININYNVADKFIFFIFPIAVYIVAAGYVFMRFSSMRFGVATLGMSHSPKITKILRFLVVRGDKMLLVDMPTSMPGMSFWDTPAIYTLTDNESMTPGEVEEIFTDISGINKFRLRKLYDVYHTEGSQEIGVYAAFISDDSEVQSLDGEWLTLYAIDRLYNSGLLTKQMNYDIRRIFIMTMAWKTYTREGKRLYPIKNYRPTFHLSDFKDWDLDYSDLHWFDVHEINEDRSFWRLRKFWRKYVSGVSSKLQ